MLLSGNKPDKCLIKYVLRGLSSIVLSPKFPSQAFKRHAELGYFAVTTGLDIPLPGGIPLKEWDSWHTLILTDEIGRIVSFLYIARNSPKIQRGILA
jgi:hypothetical protein